MATEACLMPDAKFESSSLSSFGDMTSQSFHLKKGTSRRIRYLPPENGFNFKKKSFMSRFVLFDPKLVPHVNFSNFQAEGNVFQFQNFWRGPGGEVLMRKERQQPPPP